MAVKRMLLLSFLCVDAVGWVTGTCDPAHKNSDKAVLKVALYKSRQPKMESFSVNCSVVFEWVDDYTVHLVTLASWRVSGLWEFPSIWFDYMYSVLSFENYVHILTYFNNNWIYIAPYGCNFIDLSFDFATGALGPEYVQSFFWQSVSRDS